MALDSGISGARFALDASELTKKPAINMTIAGSSINDSNAAITMAT